MPRLLPSLTQDIPVHETLSGLKGAGVGLLLIFINHHPIGNTSSTYRGPQASLHPPPSRQASQARMWMGTVNRHSLNIYPQFQGGGHISPCPRLDKFKLILMEKIILVPQPPSLATVSTVGLLQGEKRRKHESTVCGCVLLCSG